MTSCQVYRSLASDRIDGPLTPLEERALKAHLAICRDCAEHAEDLALMARLLRGAGSGEREATADEVTFAVLERVAGDDAEAVAHPLWHPLRWLLLRSPLPSSAAAVLALVALLLLAAPVATRRAADAGPPPREACLLTVWDSRGDRITASVGPGDVASHRWHRVEPAPVQRGDSSHPVRMYLYERIIVNNP